jgi:hypothetical protein
MTFPAWRSEQLVKAALVIVLCVLVGVMIGYALAERDRRNVGRGCRV